MAILVGDLLFSAAFQLVADLADSRFAMLLAGAVRAISESEILQMKRIDPENPRYRQYLHQIIGKTAVLFSVSCRTGAELAQADARTIQTLQRAGYDIGMAFQIIDDIMDFAEDGGTTGKTPGRDLELGIITLPVLAALRQLPAGSADRNALAALLGREHLEAGDIDRIRSLTRQHCGFDTARQWAERYTRRALAECARLPDTPARAELTTLTRELLQRQY
jgi:heptaprenyl diphosphate synthase